MLGNPSLNNQSAVATTYGVTFVSKFIPAAIILIFIGGVVFFFASLITGAITWISSNGDKSALEVARSKITNAIVGIIILFSAYALLTLIKRFFGLTILTLDLTPLVN